MQVPPHSSGSLVFKTDPLAPANEALSQNDVVTEIDGISIADGGRPPLALQHAPGQALDAACLLLSRPSRPPVDSHGKRCDNCAAGTVWASVGCRWHH